METDIIPIQEQTESCELELTAKGTYKWTVKIRSKLMDEKDLARLETIDNWLRNKYAIVT